MVDRPIVQLQGVHFAYPRSGFALCIERLDVSAGEHVAVVGPSGSGKTTLLALIAGILVPSAGRVQLAGRPISAMSDRLRRLERITRIGMVFQDFALLEYLSVRDNILLPYHVSPGLRLTAAVAQRVEQLSGAVGLTNLLRRRPRELSQGERQRVAVCRALITEPALLTCDEPTGSLDAAAAGQVLDLLIEQARRCRAAVVVVTHDRAVRDRFARVIDLGAPGGLTC